MNYFIDTTSHLNPHLNRVSLQATYKLSRDLGFTQEQHLQIMRGRKDDIRRRDAEPAAWFTWPTRMEWAGARDKRGEFKTYEELGRAISGEEVKS